MNVLRQAFEALGFSGTATLLGSGNVVFESKAEDVELLEKKIERKFRRTLSYRVLVFIRTHAELKQITALEPFGTAKIPGADVNIIILAQNLDEKSKAKLMALRTETDGFRVHGREIYWWRRKKPGTSLYSTVPLAKVLREPFTIRGINTIRKLVAKWP